MEENYDLKKIATAQRGMLICLLVNVLCLIGNRAGLGPVVLVVMILQVVAALYFVFNLATSLKYSNAVAVLCCILMFIPLLCLLTMGILSGKATKILKENGIKVGLLGANVKD